MYGYKTLSSDLKNKYGMKFEKNKVYTVSGELKFGVNGNGYHFCTNFEDSLKYNEAFTRNFKLAKVKASGDILESFDRYNGIYGIYVARNIEILDILTEEELFLLSLELKGEKIERFLKLYPYTEEEKERFINEYKNIDLSVIRTFDYYQRNIKDAYDPWKYLEIENGYVKTKRWK